MLCGIYAYLFYSIMGCIVFLQVTNKRNTLILEVNYSTSPPIERGYEKY